MATTKIIGKVSIIPCGTYVDGTTYTRLSVVNYQGGSYIALVDNTNIVPTNDSVWYLLTAPGRGIQQIEKIGTVGLVDTYRITYTDGTHFDYTVNNGATKTSELDNDAGFITNQVNNLANYLLAVDTGAYIELSYDSEGYTVTANLKNSSDTIISTGTAQLPLGGNYVSSGYNDGVITLTKLNGTSDTVELDDLVKKSTTIAGLDLGNDITTQELIEALDVYTIPEINDNFVSNSASGESVYIDNSSNLTLKGFQLKGNATQADTPTPDTPQDIHVVTGDNTLGLCGKNLAWYYSATNNWAYDFVTRINNSGIAYLTTEDNRSCLRYNANAGSGSYDTKYVFKIKGGFKENTQYTFSLDIKSASSTGNLGVEYTDGTKTNFTVTANTWTHKVLTTTLGKTVKYLRAVYDTSFTYIDLDTFQCEENTTATTYEPYTEQTQILSLGSIELAKIGDYTDRIYKDSGKWYLEKNIEKIENYNGETIDTNYISSTGGLDIGAIVYYQLTTPTTTEITNTTLLGQLENVLKMRTYNNITNIFTQTNNAQPYLYIDYYINNVEMIKDIQEENTKLYQSLLDQIPQVTIEGQFINVKDSSNLPIQDFQIQGNTSQDTNIMTYVCSGNESGYYYFVYNNVNYQFIMPTITQGELLTFNTTTLKLYQGTIEIATTFDNTGTLITLSSTPNPDYPQDIHVVTGDNTVKVLGKNLLNCTRTEQTVRGITGYGDSQRVYLNGTATSQGNWNLPSQSSIVPGTYRIELEVESGSVSNGNILFYIYTQNGNEGGGSNFIRIEQGTTRGARVFNITKPTLMYLHGYASATFSCANLVIKYQVIKDEGVSDYNFEPYIEPQTQLLSLGNIELAKIGDYQDRIYKDNGKWYVEKQLEKETIGGGHWVRVTSGVFYKLISYIQTNATVRTLNTLSNQLIWENRASSMSSMLDLHFAQDINKSIYVRNNNYDTSSEIDTWLNEKPLVLYLALATPTITEITDTTLLAQLENILKMTTYKNITNIFDIAVSPNETPYLQVTYKQDLDTLLDNLDARLSLLE